MSFIEMKNICKKYAGADKNSVTDFSLSVEEGEFIAFVGPSGCGKSTTLRMIAGFEEITSGDFYIDGKRMNAVLPRDRGISMVFQNYALYPHMTVEKNISYGLKNMKVPAAEIKKKVDWAIDILGLSEYRYRKPKNLSGGQRQRCIEPCFTDHLIQTSGDYTGGCTIAGLAVVRSEHDDHEIERIVHFHSDTDHIQPPAALAELILKDSSPAAKSFLYNMIFWTKLLLKKSSPSCIFIKASGLIRLVSPGIRIAKA